MASATQGRLDGDSGPARTVMDGARTNMTAPPPRSGEAYLADRLTDRFRPSPIFLASRDRRLEYLEAVTG